MDVGTIDKFIDVFIPLGIMTDHVQSHALNYAGEVEEAFCLYLYDVSQCRRNVTGILFEDTFIKVK